MQETPEAASVRCTSRSHCEIRLSYICNGFIVGAIHSRHSLAQREPLFTD